MSHKVLNIKDFSDLLYDVASHHKKLNISTSRKNTSSSEKKYKLTQHFIGLFRNTI